MMKFFRAIPILRFPEIKKDFEGEVFPVEGNENPESGKHGITYPT